jgi:hypothetical protein
VITVTQHSPLGSDPGGRDIFRAPVASSAVLRRLKGANYPFHGDLGRRGGPEHPHQCDCTDALNNPMDRAVVA